MRNWLMLRKRVNRPNKSFVRRDSQQHRWLHRYIAAVVGLGALGTLSVLTTAEPGFTGSWVGMAVVAGLAMLAYWFPFLRTGTAGARSYHLTEAPLAAGLLLLDPRRVLIAFLIGVVISFAMSGLPGVKKVFGVGSYATGAALAVLVVVLADKYDLPGAPGAFIPLAAATYFAVNHVLLCAVFELAGVRRPGEPFLVDMGYSSFVSVVATLTGIFVGLVGRAGAGPTLLSVVPIALVFLLSGAHAKRARTVELLQGIVDAASDTHAGMTVAQVEEAMRSRVIQVLDCPHAEFRDDGPHAGELGSVVETQSGSRWLIAHPRTIEPFRPEEARLLRALAGMAGRALENAHLHDQLARQALHDPLTGLPNRRLVTRELTAAVGRASRSANEYHGHIGVAFLDLTGFKAVNDGMGHDAGDELLCEIADRLSQSVRVGDVVGRFGGDEYVVLFLSPEDGDVAAAAARVVRSFETPFVVSGEPVAVGCNVGLALWPTHGTEAEDLLRRADAAMYTAKRAGTALALATPPAAVAARRY